MYWVIETFPRLRTRGLSTNCTLHQWIHLRAGGERSLNFASLSKSIYPLLFTDDTNFFISHSNISTFNREFNVALTPDSNWFKVNKLPLNIKNLII